MKIKYHDLVNQTFEFPQPEFNVNAKNELEFHGISLMDLIAEYGTPLKLTYVPKISENIERARGWFNKGMEEVDYQGKYRYCYCTKSSHFSFVLKEALKSGVNLETSSGFDLDLIQRIDEQQPLNRENWIICNGYKKPDYLQKINELQKKGFDNLITVLDNRKEADLLEAATEGTCKIGIRIASEEDPKFEFYTSRLGIGYKSILPYYNEHLRDNPRFELRMLHFFINTGITDTAYYWNELAKCVNVYCSLKKVCPELDSLNIGGGFPIKNSLAYDYDYAYMASEIVSQIKEMCNARGVPEPNIFTEFGSFTVGESGAAIFSILDQKIQNDREKWNMIDSSFMTTLPDTWALKKRFIMLAVNNWEFTYERVFLGGLTCDSDDYYNSEIHQNAIYLPKFREDKEQYIGFFNTGAYQESIGGYGGIQHCLVPSPKHVVVDRDEDGNLTHSLFAPEQSPEVMLRILGY